MPVVEMARLLKVFQAAVLLKHERMKRERFEQEFEAFYQNEILPKIS